MAFSISGIAMLMLSIFVVAALGYLLGRVSIKGVSLGTAGVFIVALIFGALFPKLLSENLTQTKDYKVNLSDPAEIGIVEKEKKNKEGEKEYYLTDVETKEAEEGSEETAEPVSAKAKLDYATNALKIVENVGLILFVTAVGFIAGPNFFSNFKKNFKSYILLGLIVIIAGAATGIGCIFIDRAVSGGDTKGITAMIVGILSGSLTSTPAFSAAKASVEEQYENLVTVGHGIAYLFGVVGVVLFVQIMPKINRADMKEERAKLKAVDTGKKKEYKGKLIDMDPFGFMPFALAAVIGICIGAVKIANFFSLTTTGGALIASLLFGHFAHFGPVNVTPKESTLKVFRELGLMLFLIGAGIAGGINFVKYFKVIYFFYGVAMTIVPMIIGYFFAKYVLKLSLLNNLGSITGGMTSTPALGTLINVAGTEDVANAYASTYPIALISVVLASILMINFFA